MVRPLPDYRNPDLSGEALQAAARMEAHATFHGFQVQSRAF
jgi:hypothetical protein